MSMVDCWGLIGAPNTLFGVYHHVIWYGVYIARGRGLLVPLYNYRPIKRLQAA